MLASNDILYSPSDPHLPSQPILYKITRTHPYYRPPKTMSYGDASLSQVRCLRGVWYPLVLGEGCLTLHGDHCRLKGGLHDSKENSCRYLSLVLGTTKSTKSLLFKWIKLSQSGRCNWGTMEIEMLIFNRCERAVKWNISHISENLFRVCPFQQILDAFMGNHTSMHALSILNT